jgi:hypothetical protein
MKFCDICSLQMGQFMFSYKHGLLPANFDSFFVLNSEVHSYLTRNAKSFHLPLCRTNICQFSIRYQGPKFFNSLRDEIVNSVSFQTFTFRLKSLFIWIVTINIIHSILTIHRIRWTTALHLMFGVAILHLLICVIFCNLFLGGNPWFHKPLGFSFGFPRHM